MTTSLIYPLQELIALYSGSKTRMALLRQDDHLYDTSSGDAPRLINRAGHVHAVVGKELPIVDPTRQQRATVQLTGIDPVPMSLTNLRPADALAFGYADLTDLWHAWTSRHDDQAYGWWNACKDLFQPDPYLRTKGFRKFLKTRHPKRYMAWIFTIAPVGRDAVPDSIAQFLQSIR